MNYMELAGMLDGVAYRYEVSEDVRKTAEENGLVIVIGASDDLKNLQHHRCWAVYATIRHALAWHDHPEGGYTVNFNEPMGYGEPLPKCEVKEG